eukprot:CAMPEP_0172445236 /NCGR_PEP_ID=MMETSP1065-20121228/5122_1 /TAXON_ID=265537 /ORGANISM="Amphiprora paludosa, Strain CCMP125" /LENGTH=542 /DNA_ID=CAMNT_0013196035 /DNA_START=212 /DNA_END=1840 /DNA_ORIENTATION=+
MPHKGSPRTLTSTDHTAGADLLLSLAETASEHAPQHTAYRQESSSRKLLPPVSPAETSKDLLNSSSQHSSSLHAPTLVAPEPSSTSTVTASEASATNQVPVTPSPLVVHSTTSRGGTASNMQMSVHGNGSHRLMPSPIKLPKSEPRRASPNVEEEQEHTCGTKRRAPERTESESSEETPPTPSHESPAKQPKREADDKRHASPTSTQEAYPACPESAGNTVISPTSSQEGHKSPPKSPSPQQPQQPLLPHHVPPPHPALYRMAAPHYHPYGPPPPPQPWMHHPGAAAPYYHHAPPAYPGYYAMALHPASYAAAQQPPPPVAASTPKKQAQKSIEDWQKTRVTVGNKARCVPLEEPTKARKSVPNPEEYEAKLPDFPLLVNFPEHLTRGQTRGSGDQHGLAPEGKRHCVMCGQLRICSSSANRLNRSTAPSDSADSTVHIIPRQNKGVCTACDVTVWCVRVEEPTTPSLEIKWCKGCKNFRPWPAFGEKGLATKCARCRHRQREKYAMQKRQNNTTRGNYDFQKEDDILAAQGLSNLMRAQNA